MLDFLQPLSLCSAPVLDEKLQPACVAATGALATAGLSVLGVITAAIITGGVNIYLKVMERRNKVYELYLPDKRKAIDEILDTLRVIIPETTDLAMLVKNCFADPSEWPIKALRLYVSGDPSKLNELKELWAKTQRESFRLMATGSVNRRTMRELLKIVDKASGVFDAVGEIAWALVVAEVERSGESAVDLATNVIQQFLRQNPREKKLYQDGVRHLEGQRKGTTLSQKRQSLDDIKLLWHGLYLMTYSLEELSKDLQRRLYAEKLK